MRKHFVTFGSETFRRSRERIVAEARATGFFDEVRLYTPDNLPSDFDAACEISPDFRKVASNRRGHGFWVWKPCVINHLLNEIDDGDFLLYADAGCEIGRTAAALHALGGYVAALTESEKGVLRFRNPYREGDWTKGDIFQHFEVPDSFAESRQFRAGILVFRRCESSMLQTNLWWDTARAVPHLFSDEPTRTRPNFPGFRENRHDQSVFSIIAKKYGTAEIPFLDDAVVRASRIRG